MKSFTYIQYFFYIAFNWNLRLAISVIYHEIIGEKKYRINTSGYSELQHLSKKGIDISHATLYMPAAYNVLEDIFTFLLNKPNIHFLDIGCGKGRTLSVAPHYGFNKVTGIDFSEKMINSAFLNLQSVKKTFPALEYSVQTCNAIDYVIPHDVDVIFLFNPFDRYVTNKVAGNIMESIQKFPRNIFIVYENPLYKDIFLQTGFKEVYFTKKMEYLEASILQWEKNKPYQS
jgi:SAM-dependent methyltransferase